MPDIMLPYVKEIRFYVKETKNYSVRLLKKISQCRNVVKLIVGGMCTTIIPKEILSLSLLTYLDISNNYYKQLPKEIYSLSELKFLNVSGSGIEMIPFGIGRLSCLECLIISNNNIIDFPEDFFDLEELRYLGMFKNKFSELSDDMGYLINLTGLDVGGNPIEYLFSSINNLIHLKEINLIQTLIKTLPDSFCDISQNCELIINSQLLMDNLPINLQYLTVHHVQDISWCGYYKPAFTNLPTSMRILYYSGNINIPNSKLGLNTQIIKYKSHYDNFYRYRHSYQFHYETDHNETYYDETDYYETNYDETNYDETDYDETNYDETDYDETNYDETDVMSFYGY
jgi:hypothetical protein